MSASEIMAELPKLSQEERAAVARRLRELGVEEDMQFLEEAARQAFAEMDKLEKEDARRKAR